DEVERPTGSLATPTNGSLEAMIIQEEREELLASVRRLPTTAQVQLPDQATESPAYVRGAVPQPATANPVPSESQTGSPAVNSAAAALNLRPIDSSVKTLDIGKTADTSMQNIEPDQTPVAMPDAAAVPAVSPAPLAELQISADMPVMKKGDKTKIAIMVKSTSLFRSAVLGLRFDDKKLAVRSVSFGDIFGAGIANTNAAPFLNQDGKMNVSLSLAQGTVGSGSGILAYVEIEALTDGKPEMTLEKDVLNFLAADGKNFAVKF
ncbi:MAG: hypothetical protein H7070_05000, partial [Saprospiraceae bacterium]|nr:hypothetical protein [Pyrinomonadaceae bacterium]